MRSKCTLEVEQLQKDIQLEVNISAYSHTIRGLMALAILIHILKVDIPNQWVKLYIDSELQKYLYLALLV